MLQHRSVQREQRNIRSGIAKEKQGGTHMCTLVTCIVLELDNSILVVQSFRKEYTRNSNFLCFSEVSPCQTLCPHARHCVPIQDTVSPCKTLCPHARHCVPMPDTVSPCQTLCPHARHCVPMPDTVSPCQTQCPHARHFGLFANNNITCATTHARKCTETQLIYIF